MVDGEGGWYCVGSKYERSRYCRQIQRANHGVGKEIFAVYMTVKGDITVKGMCVHTCPLCIYGGMCVCVCMHMCVSCIYGICA